MEHDIKMALSFQRGEREGFEYFFNKLFVGLVGYGYRFIKDQDVASDIAEHAFMKIWERRETFSHHLVIQDYLYVIVKNECLRLFNKQKTIDKYVDGYNKYEISRLSDCEADQTLIKSEAKRIVHDWLGKLPPECSKIMKLMYVDGLSSREIANHLEVSISTVKNQKARGLECIKSIEEGKYKKNETLAIAPPPELAKVIFIEVPKKPTKEEKPAFIPWKNGKRGRKKNEFIWSPSERNERIYKLFNMAVSKKDLANIFDLKPETIGNIIRDEWRSERVKELFIKGKKVQDIARIVKVAVKDAIERINYIFKTNLYADENGACFATYQAVQQNNQDIHKKERPGDTECLKEKYG